MIGTSNLIRGLNYFLFPYFDLDVNVLEVELFFRRTYF